MNCYKNARHVGELLYKYINDGLNKSNMKIRQPLQAQNMLNWIIQGTDRNIYIYIEVDLEETELEGILTFSEYHK